MIESSLPFVRLLCSEQKHDCFRSAASLCRQKDFGLTLIRCVLTDSNLRTYEAGSVPVAKWEQVVNDPDCAGHWALSMTRSPSQEKSWRTGGIDHLQRFEWYLYPADGLGEAMVVSG
jgi:hypothetical protein